MPAAETPSPPEPPSFDATVIIPTLAEPSRRRSLLGAIDCVLRQQGVRALPLVVINGERYDRELRRELEARTDIQVRYREPASVTAAQAFGVEQVRTPYFAFLDDDDLFTEDALAHRIALMEATPAADFVVTNFYFERNGERRLACDDIGIYAAEPAHSIFEFAWCSSVNTLFRTASVDADFFRPKVPQMEWTALGIRLARERRAVFSNRATGIYVDTPDSASKRSRHTESMIALMRSLRHDDLPHKTRRLIERKYVGGYHLLAQAALQSGRPLAAWRYHLHSLARPQGWRYLTFTRKLLWPRSR